MKRRLADHLQSSEFKPNDQWVALGVQPAPDGDGVFVVLKIERCIDRAQAAWIANMAAADLQALVGADPADESVMQHCYQQPTGPGWTAAIGLELADRASAEAFAEVVAAYADPGPGGGLN